MSTQSLALFKAIGAKMDYLSTRQALIAENIANADTPGYRPKDLKPVDFRSVLKTISAEGNQVVDIKRTNNMHVTGADNALNPRTEKKKNVYEVAPVGNAVVIEEQMMSAGQNVMDYNLMTNLYQKYIGMVKTVAASG